MGNLQVIVKERLLKNWHTLGHLNVLGTYEVT